MSPDRVTLDVCSEVGTGVSGRRLVLIFILLNSLFFLDLVETELQSFISFNFSEIGFIGGIELLLRNGGGFKNPLSKDFELRVIGLSYDVVFCSSFLNGEFIFDVDLVAGLGEDLKHSDKGVSGRFLCTDFMGFELGGGVKERTTLDQLIQKYLINNINIHINIIHIILLNDKIDKIYLTHHQNEICQVVLEKKCVNYS